MQRPVKVGGEYIKSEAAGHAVLELATTIIEVALK
jgi:hypothetical protein